MQRADCRITTLNLGTVELDSSFLVLGHKPGEKRQVPAYAFLIKSELGPILVDTGYRSVEIMKRVGMTGIQPAHQTLEAQLNRCGLAPSDIVMVVHTHLHIDHAGRDDLFPMTTPVILDREELAFSVCGVGGYQPEDIKHLVDRLHTKDALRFLDLNKTATETIAPGVRCVAAQAHTPGSLIVEVDTADGLIGICGDIIYDIQNQVVSPPGVKLQREPRVTGNHTETKVREAAAIKRILNTYDILMPSHDGPARVEAGRIMDRPKAGQSFGEECL